MSKNLMIYYVLASSCFKRAFRFYCSDLSRTLIDGAVFIYLFASGIKFIKIKHLIVSGSCIIKHNLM